MSDLDYAKWRETLYILQADVSDVKVLSPMQETACQSDHRGSLSCKIFAAVTASGLRHRFYDIPENSCKPKSCFAEKVTVISQPYLVKNL